MVSTAKFDPGYREAPYSVLARFARWKEVGHSLWTRKIGSHAALARVHNPLAHDHAIHAVAHEEKVSRIEDTRPHGAPRRPGAIFCIEPPIAWVIEVPNLFLLRPHHQLNGFRVRRSEV